MNIILICYCCSEVHNVSVSDIARGIRIKWLLLSANRYTSLLIPHAPGAAVDLSNNQDLGQIILQFIKDKSKIYHTTLKVEVLLGLILPLVFRDLMQRSLIDGCHVWCYISKDGGQFYHIYLRALILDFIGWRWTFFVQNVDTFTRFSAFEYYL
jgi:hypothetical protein